MTLNLNITDYPLISYFYFDCYLLFKHFFNIAAYSLSVEASLDFQIIHFEQIMVLY